MAKLFYQGHGSFRITTNNGTVIYVDPYVGEGYEMPADLVLVTHGHDDHNQVDKTIRKKNSRVITHVEALNGDVHNTFNVFDVTIRAVDASNVNHDPRQCVGYVLEFDGIKLYASGDTSATKFMPKMKELNLDYALFPCDGFYNMSAEEAAACARVVGAKNNIPIHTKPGALFDLATALRFDAPNRIIVLPSQEIDL